MAKAGPPPARCLIYFMYAGTYPDSSPVQAGGRHVFRQFAIPGGIHAAPDAPGPIHEGGKLATRWPMPKARCRITVTHSGHDEAEASAIMGQCLHDCDAATTSDDDAMSARMAAL